MSEDSMFAMTSQEREVCDLVAKSYKLTAASRERPLQWPWEVTQALAAALAERDAKIAALREELADGQVQTSVLVRGLDVKVHEAAEFRQRVDLMVPEAVTVLRNFLRSLPMPTDNVHGWLSQMVALDDYLDALSSLVEPAAEPADTAAP